METFFSLPLDEKMRVHTTKTGGLRGYIGMYEQGNYGYDATDSRLEKNEVIKEKPPKMDAKEVFTLGPEPQPFSNMKYNPALFSKNVWPEHDKSFEKDIWDYYTNMQALSVNIFSLIALSLGLPYDYFDNVIKEPMHSMNMIHYPPSTHIKSPDDEDQMGIGAHSDFECFTLLSQNNTEGLEIYINEQWISIPPYPEAFVVNIGDMMARWTNDQYRSTIHRARNHSSRDRYSIAYFCACDYDTTLESLIPGENPKYPPIKAGVHLLERIYKANASVINKTEI